MSDEWADAIADDMAVVADNSAESTEEPDQLEVEADGISSENSVSTLSEDVVSSDVVETSDSSSESTQGEAPSRKRHWIFIVIAIVIGVLVALFLFASHIVSTQSSGLNSTVQTWGTSGDGAADASSGKTSKKTISPSKSSKQNSFSDSESFDMGSVFGYGDSGAHDVSALESDGGTSVDGEYLDVSANVDLSTKDYAAGMSELSATLTEFGAHIASRDDTIGGGWSYRSSDGRERSGQAHATVLHVDIASDKVYDFLNKLSGLSSLRVENMVASAEDASASVGEGLDHINDVLSRYDERIHELTEKRDAAGSDDERAALDAEISALRKKVDDANAERSDLEQSFDTGTVVITVHEMVSFVPNNPTPLDVFNQSMQDTFSTWGVIGARVLAALLFALPLGIISGLVVFIVIKVRRKRASSVQNSTQNSGSEKGNVE